MRQCVGCRQHGGPRELADVDVDERAADYRADLAGRREPADFGGMAVYLASDASRFHTGDSFLIDGGYGVF